LIFQARIFFPDLVHASKLGVPGCFPGSSSSL
jgi:hypothetical protein